MPTTSQIRDLEDLKLGVLRAREIGNAAALHPYTKREHAPGNLTETELEEYIRNGLKTFWHQSGTAKMGRDAMSVVDSELRVYGVEGLYSGCLHSASRDDRQHDGAMRHYR